MRLTKRQRQIADFIGEFISGRGYAPSIAEIGRRFGLASLATVHKHLVNLEKKGAISREKRRSRSIELVPAGDVRLAGVVLPLLGAIAAGRPIEALPERESMAVPEGFAGKGSSFVLRVRGESMIEEGIRDGDYVVVEKRQAARDGETVVALVRGEEATLKKLRHGKGTVTLLPANPALEPLTLPADDVAVQGVVVAVLRKYR